MNSETQKQLEAQLFRINWDEYDTLAHRTIYDEVASTVEAVGSDVADVPPALLFYGIRNILYPTFILGQIPDLLNLLTTIEGLRQFATQRIGQILALNQLYTEHPPDDQEVRILTTKETRTLAHYQAQSSRLRKKYFVLLQNLCQVYIHYLWTSPESCLLAMRLNDFFPGCLEGYNKPSSLHFHMDLNENEKAEFGGLKDEVSAWMKTILEWEYEREKSGKQKGYSKTDLKASFKDEFQVAFPPLDYADILDVLVTYLTSVEDMTKRLEKWFPALT
ncbi:hypothetical protein EDC04DRAFT_866221 [Pisolithus marmoratus]|nr:hypothetical protein EDC04DRAFT_866221 [Pisolithus marmoratus]